MSYSLWSDEYKNPDFLTSSEKDIERFADAISEGEIVESKFNKIFDNIINKEYTEEEAIIVIKNIIIAQYQVNFNRTDFQVRIEEALLYLATFINKEGSINVKLIYALFSVAFEVEELKEEGDEIAITYEKNTKTNGNIFLELNERLKTMSEKDKPLVLLEKEVFSDSIKRLFNRK